MISVDKYWKTLPRGMCGSTCTNWFNSWPNERSKRSMEVANNLWVRATWTHHPKNSAAEPPGNSFLKDSTQYFPLYVDRNFSSWWLFPKPCQKFAQIGSFPQQLGWKYKIFWNQHAQGGPLQVINGLTSHISKVISSYSHPFIFSLL